MHMIFAGNPGTAKTTVARLFPRIAKERDILKSSIFVEKAGRENTNEIANEALFLIEKEDIQIEEDKKEEKRRIGF